MGIETVWKPYRLTSSGPNVNVYIGFEGKDIRIVFEIGRPETVYPLP